MVSIIIPAKGEKEHLQKTITGLKKLGFRRIFVIVDDREDISYKTAKSLKAEIILNKGRGFASAVLTGLRTVNDDLLVLMDAENHRPDEVPKMVELSNKTGADLILGSRFIRGSKINNPLFRVGLSTLTNFILQLAYGVSDVSSGFRVYRKKNLEKILKSGFTSKHFEIQAELAGKILLNRGKIVEYPIQFQQREHGESKFRFFKMAKGFFYQWLSFIFHKILGA